MKLVLVSRAKYGIFCFLSLRRRGRGCSAESWEVWLRWGRFVFWGTFCCDESGLSPCCDIGSIGTTAASFGTHREEKCAPKMHELPFLLSFLFESAGSFGSVMGDKMGDAMNMVGGLRREGKWIII